MSAVSRPGLRRRMRPIELPRDTDVTAFTLLLSELIGRIPGARAAALVDADGESIDYAGTLSPFDVKIAAAHWQIVLGEVGRVPLLAGPRQIVVRGLEKSFVLRVLADGYAVVVVLAARAGFAASARGFSVFERALMAEAGIGRPQRGVEWTPVVVEYDARARPRTLAVRADAPPQALEVLGAVMGLGRGERGFRVRLATGVETTVVREPGGAWYADERIDAGDGASGPR
jgi:hypothetical protein